jgi:transposase
MAGVVEIVIGREHRRCWSTEDKLRLIAETYESGTAVRAVAARHDVCESLIFTWSTARTQWRIKRGAEVGFCPDASDGAAQPP